MKVTLVIIIIIVIIIILITVFPYTISMQLLVKAHIIYKPVN